MNARQDFGQWLNRFPEKHGGSNNSRDNKLLPILEYFLMAIEDGVFDELGVVWKGNTIIYKEHQYCHPYSSIQKDTIQSFQSFELLFHYLMGFSPRVFTDWENLATIPRGKFAQAILGVAN